MGIALYSLLVGFLTSQPQDHIFVLTCYLLMEGYWVAQRFWDGFFASFYFSSL